MIDSATSASSAPELIGVGSPLVDLVATIDHEFLAAHVPGAKGGMELVSADDIHAILTRGKLKPTRAAGGAASNTTVGASNLGIRTAFIGSCGNDDFGTYYRSALHEQGCDARLVTHETLPTGRVLSLVTPDAERTMRTCLGAAAALPPEHFSAETFAGTRVVMLEGYTLFNHDLTRAIARAAKAAGAKLALDLASFEVVNFNRAVLQELLDGQVDLVFANEDEAKAWADGGSPETALLDLAKRVPIAVVKLGKDGALIAHQDRQHRVHAELVENAIDTTGAGDCWAAGFLSGWLRGLPLHDCGVLGAKCGAAVVQVMGGQVPRAQWLPLKGWLDAWK